MMQRLGMIFATAMLLSGATSAAPAVAAQRSVTWLIFVDDLHLDFRNTGRLRDLLRRISREVIQDGDSFAIRSSGPSSLAVEVTQERVRLTAAIQKATGNGLKPSDVVVGPRHPTVPSEVQYRATGALSAAREFLIATPGVDATAMIYVSNGYDVDQRFREQVPELTHLAQDMAVKVFALDPRGLMAAIAADPLADPDEWEKHLTTTRESLRMLVEPTGGWLMFEQKELAAALKRIGSAMRAAR